MANTYFQFKQFIIHQDQCAMKVTTDACLFGAWAGERVRLARRSLSEGGSWELGVSSPGRRVKKVLDIGAGTGLLSLMMAQRDPSVFIDSIELDKAAAEQARQNASASPWADRIRIIHADVREYSFTNKYDIIISNPPFYEKELKADNSKKNMARHDESLLLPELLVLIKKQLEPDGHFFLLLPYKRHEEIRELLLLYEITVRELQLVRPSAGHGYFRMMILGQIKMAPVTEINIGEIAVRDEHNAYTPAFTHLLKDFYLHL